MKATQIKFRPAAISTALYIAGIIISSGALYEYQLDPSEVPVTRICLNIGVTFFMGLIAIHFTARSIKQTTVYLQKQQANIRSDERTADSDNQLTMAPINEILQGANVSHRLIQELASQLQAGQVALFVASGPVLELKSGFALASDRSLDCTFNFGEGLVGSVAKEGRSLYIDALPHGYITVFSGLGSASPTFLAVIPLRSNDETKGVLEIALFRPLSASTLNELENIGKAWAQAGL